MEPPYTISVTSTANKHWGQLRPERRTQHRSAKGMGFGEGHCTSSPTWRLGGIVSRKILNCNTKICAFLSILHQPLCQIICTASTLSAIYNNENNYDKLWGDIRYSVPGWPNIAGDVSPVALTPLVVSDELCSVS